MARLPDQIDVGWKLDHGEPVLLVYTLGSPVPSPKVVDGETRACPDCGYEHAMPVVRWPSDVLLFFALTGVSRGPWRIGRG